MIGRRPWRVRVFKACEPKKEYKTWVPSCYQQLDLAAQPLRCAPPGATTLPSNSTRKPGTREGADECSGFRTRLFFFGFHSALTVRLRVTTVIPRAASLHLIEKITCACLMLNISCNGNSWFPVYKSPIWLISMISGCWIRSKHGCFQLIFRFFSVWPLISGYLGISSR